MTQDDDGWDTAVGRAGAGTTRPVHEDPYPSRFAMEAAVELEVHAALGRVQTQTVGKVIQRAIDKAIAAERSQ